MPPKVLKTETIYRGRTFSVRLDDVEYQPGRTTRMEIVEHTGAAVMAPLDAERNIWFVRQYRHAAGTALLELPAGTLGREEDPAAGAARELQEEIGMRAGKLERLASFWLAPGYSTELMHAFLATELTPSQLPPDEDEDLHIEKVPWQQALAMAQTGEIQDAKSLACLFAVARRLE